MLKLYRKVMILTANYLLLISLSAGYCLAANGNETDAKTHQAISPLISAEVLLKSQSGRSLIDDSTPITSQNIDEFTPSTATIEEATQRFQALGFTVPIAGTTLTVVGEVARFEEVFMVKLNLQVDESSGSIVVYPAGELVIPSSLNDVIEAVTFPKPPELYQ